MADFIVVMILLVIIGMAVVYIIKAKKQGVKCIGCPAAGKCAGAKGGNSKCNCKE